MNIAMIECGFIADYYINTPKNYSWLVVLGAMDRNPERSIKFSKFYAVLMYDSLENISNNSHVGIVLNLTNPKSRFEVTKACLEAEKHVYFEKLIAMNFEEAQPLVDLVVEKGLYLSSAP